MPFGPWPVLVITVGEPMQAIDTDSRRAYVQEVIISKHRPRRTGIDEEPGCSDAA
jgi:hypothetical protein